MQHATLRTFGGTQSFRRSAQTGDRLIVEILRNDADVDRVKNEWTSVAEKACVDIFQTVEWQRQWWKFHGRNRQLHMIAFRRHGVLVGVAPLYFETPNVFGLELPRSLCLLGTHPHEPGPVALDVIATPEEEREVALAFTSYLISHADMYSRLILGSVSESSMIFRTIVPLWEQMGWTFDISHADARARVLLPDSLDQFLMEYDSELRERFIDSSKMVTRAKAYSLSAADTVLAVQESLRRVAQTEGRGTDHTVLNSDGHPTSTSAECIAMMSSKGLIWTVEAERQDVLVASRCLGTFKGKAFNFHTFSSAPFAQSRREPDGAVLLLTIEELIARNCGVLYTDVEDPLLRDHPARSTEILHTITLASPVRPVAANGNVATHSNRGSILRWFSSHTVASTADARERTRNAPPTLEPSAAEVPLEMSDSRDKPRELREVSIPGNTPAPMARPASDGYSASVVRKESEFFALRSAWNSLEERSSLRVFQTFDWLWHWWKHFGEGLQLYILCVREHGALVAVLPMFLDVYTVFGRDIYRQLRLLGSGVPISRVWGPPATLGVSDYLDLIIHPDHRTGAAAAIGSFLRAHTSDFDEISWANVPQHGELDMLMQQALAGAGFSLVRKTTEICPFVQVPHSVDDFLMSLDSGVRRRFSQARRLFKGHPAYTVESVRSEKLLTKALDDLIHLHQRRWRRLGYPGLFADRRFESFLRDVVGEMHERGLVWLSSVRMGGVRMAVRMGFMFRDRMYDYLSGFDDDAPGASKRPGYVLFLEMIEAAIRNGAGVIDMLRGPEAYKFELTSESARNILIRVRDRQRAFTPRRVVFIVVHSVLRIVQRCTAEMQLLKIHLEEHGPWNFVFRYISFRFRSILAHNGQRSVAGSSSAETEVRETKLTKETTTAVKDKTDGRSTKTPELAVGERANSERTDKTLSNTKE